MQGFHSRRLKIIEPGLVGYNGDIGGVEFVDGVSVYAVGWLDADRIGSCIQIEDFDKPGSTISPATRLNDIRHTAADNPNVQAVGVGVAVDGEVRIVGQLYSREELEGIADVKGLQGLRDIANVWGVSARAVVDMIDRIMKAQEPYLKSAEKEVISEETKPEEVKAE